ncbi:carbon monoxide dehydrogenase [Streptomyces sp. ZYX-F-203]
MQHEVFVPVPAERLGRTLADPERVADALPGLQRDGGAEPVSGRLRLRIAGHSITYQGTARPVARDDPRGAAQFEVEGAEVRGSGTVSLRVALGAREAEGGALLVVSAEGSAGGRIVELPPDAVGASALKLLNGFARNLAGLAAEAGSEGAEPAPRAEGEAGSAPPGDRDAASREATAAPDPEDVPRPTADGGDETDPAPAPPSGSEAEEAFDDLPEAGSVPEVSARDDDRASSPSGSEAEEAFDDLPEAGSVPEVSARDDDRASSPSSPDLDGSAELRGSDPDTDGRSDPAGSSSEAVHARRTMIGRSAEEVDHAPPRGRYAPEPGRRATASAGPPRWAAPAAALAVAGAVVVGRALRRRR